MSLRSDEDDRDFGSSELGTKQYWDSTYQLEVQNFEDTNDVGEIWFGEDSQERIVDWLDDCDDINKEDDVIDLGCGNGVMLIELMILASSTNPEMIFIQSLSFKRKRGFKNLTGVDYSENGIDLAKAISEKEGMSDITYEVCDLITENACSKYTCLTRNYKVVHDKGTYDALSLMPEHSMESRKCYLSILKHILHPDGHFVITSCNWTKEQLLKFFETDFDILDAIPTPSFMFGGKKGNTVTSLIFRHKS